MPLPNAGPCDDHDAADPPHIRTRHREPVRPLARPPRDDPAHTGATRRSLPAWPAWDAGRGGWHATARSLPDTRDRRRESRVTPHLPRDRRRRTSDPTRDLTHPTLLERATQRSPPAQQTTDAPRQRVHSPGGIPPPSRSHRTPTVSDTPASPAAPRSRRHERSLPRTSRRCSLRHQWRPPRRTHRLADQPDPTSAASVSPIATASRLECCDDHLNPTSPFGAARRVRS